MHVVLCHSCDLSAGICERLTLSKEDDENGASMLVQESCDLTESLNQELLDIRLDLQRYQQDRNQLQYVL